jgi:hypothetical protein
MRTRHAQDTVPVDNLAAAAVLTVARGRLLLALRSCLRSGERLAER